MPASDRTASTAANHSAEMSRHHPKDAKGGRERELVQAQRQRLPDCRRQQGDAAAACLAVASWRLHIGAPEYHEGRHCAEQAGIRQIAPVLEDGDIDVQVPHLQGTHA